MPPGGAAVAEPLSKESNNAIAENAMKPAAEVVSPAGKALLGFATEQKAAGGDARSVFERMQQAVKPVEPHVLKGANEKYIPPSGKDASGKPEHTPAEKALVAKAEDWERINNEALEKGYEALAPADKVKITDTIDAAIKGSGIPELAATWGSNAAAQEAMIRHWFENPQMRENIKKLFDKSLKPDKLLDPQAIRDAQKEVRTQDLAVKKLTQELKLLDTQLTEARDLQDDFATGAKSAELAALIASADADTASFQTAQAEVEMYDRLLRAESAKDSLPGGKGGLSPDAVKLVGTRDDKRETALKNLSGKLAEAHKRAAEAKARVDKKANLEAQKQQVKNEAMRLTAARNIKSDELNAATTEFHVANAQLNEGTLAQETFVKGVENVVADSAMEFLLTQIQQKEELEKARLSKEKGEADDRVVKGVLDQLENRYDNEVPEGFWATVKNRDRHGKLKELWSKKHNYRAIKEDYKLLTGKAKGSIMDSAGAVIMELNPQQMLMRQYLEKGPKIVDPYEMKKWLENKDFMDKYMPQVIGKLIDKKVAINGEKSIKNKDSKEIMKTEWGQKAITEGLKKGGNVTEAKAVEDLLKTGELNETKLKKLGLSFKSLILLAIIGVAQTGIAAGKEAVK